MRIAVLLPARLVQSDKGEHVDGRLEQVQPVAGSTPVKAVLRRAAVLISLEAALGASAPLMGMTGLSLRIKPNEHGVVVIGGFIDHAFADACETSSLRAELPSVYRH